MKNIALLLLGCIVLFSSCECEEIIYDNSIAVGNIYCADGSIVNPINLKTSGKKPIGIIFFKGNDSINIKGLAISLQDIEPLAWSDSTMHFSNVSANINEFNGAKNTAAIFTVAQENNIQTPAAFRAVNYNYAGVPGWFIPSVAESREIYKTLDVIKPTLEALEGDKLSGWYWTSTEDVNGAINAAMYTHIISFENGYISSSMKMKKFKTRPIILIN